MLFIRFGGKEIPFNERWDDLEYLAYLDKLKKERSKAEGRGWSRLLHISTNPEAHFGKEWTAFCQ